MRETKEKTSDKQTHSIPSNQKEIAKLSGKTKIYIFLVFLCAAILLLDLFLQGYAVEWELFVFWSIFSVIAESLAFRLPNGVGVSIGFAFTLAAIITGGPLTAALVAAIGVTFRVLSVYGKGLSHILNTPFYKNIYNISQSLVVTIPSSAAYVRLGGVVAADKFNFSPIPIVGALLSYMFINTILISELMSLLNDRKFIHVWAKGLGEAALNFIAVGAIGIMLTFSYTTYGPGAVVLITGSLLLARYSYKLYVDTKNLYIETIRALNKSLEAKDPYTAGHASRVEYYAVKLARKLNLSEKQIDMIHTAAVLHDIGKIGVDDSILKSPNKLTLVEYREVQQHPVIGAEILSDVCFLRDTADIIRHHHERYDGKGYPDGLKGNEISIETYILTLADVYDAMTSDRPYRKALSKKEALEEIRANAGTQFHPELAKAFLDMMENDELEVKRIHHLAC